MFTNWFEGVCPQCRLAGKEITMLHNDQDFFECPDCSLQVCTGDALHAVILHNRGQGSFRTSNPFPVDQIDNPTGRTLSTEKEAGDGKYFYPITAGDFIMTEQDLKTCIAKIDQA